MRVLRFLLTRLLLAALVPALMALAIPLVAWWLMRTAWFRFSNRGRRFLVYTRRHGWNEFITNNLLPVCEPHIQAIELSRGARTPRSWRESHIQAATVGQSKPLLAEVSLIGVRCVSLNETLLPFKQHGGRKPEVQRELSDLVAPLLNRTQI
ncbi:MAG TPA: hypothetical protein VGK58_05600 [Lacipirellulaceae bacterium]